MKTQTYEEAVLKTVMWWSDKSFRSLMNQNNGDKSHQGGILSMLMNINSLEAQKRTDEEKIKKFESKLTELLMDEKTKMYGYLKELDKDYNPCKFLSEACEYAGIDSNCLPCKSFTRIEDDNRVFAKYQYGAPVVEI